MKLDFPAAMFQKQEWENAYDYPVNGADSIIKNKYWKAKDICMYEVLKIKAKSRPRYPQSVFENIPKSLITTLPSPKQPAKKAASSSRSDILSCQHS